MIRRSGIFLLLLLISSLSLFGQEKRALLIGIGKYAPETGWHQIGGNWYYLWTALGSESTLTSYDENGKVTSTTTKTEYWGGYSSKCWVDCYWIGADGICFNSCG